MCNDSSENCKTELGKTKDLLKWGYSWIERLDNCKNGHSPQNQCNPQNNPLGFFQEIDKLILKITYKCKELRITQVILKKNELGRLTLPDIRIYYETALIRLYSKGAKI